MEHAEAHSPRVWTKHPYDQRSPQEDIQGEGADEGRKRARDHGNPARRKEKSDTKSACLQYGHGHRIRISCERRMGEGIPCLGKGDRPRELRSEGSDTPSDEVRLVKRTRGVLDEVFFGDHYFLAWVENMQRVPRFFEVFKDKSCLFVVYIGQGMRSL